MKTRPQPAGKYLHCAGIYQAFIPAPLPPDIAWTANLLRALPDADRRLGQLASEGRGLPNPHLLMRPFVKHEAVLSSRIEALGVLGQRPRGIRRDSDAGRDIFITSENLARARRGVHNTRAAQPPPGEAVPYRGKWRLSPCPRHGARSD
jgi:hypothetical protein